MCVWRCGAFEAWLCWCVPQLGRNTHTDEARSHTGLSLFLPPFPSGTLARFVFSSSRLLSAHARHTHVRTHNTHTHTKTRTHTPSCVSDALFLFFLTVLLLPMSWCGSTLLPSFSRPPPLPPPRLFCAGTPPPCPATQLKTATSDDDDDDDDAPRRRGVHTHTFAPRDTPFCRHPAASSL